MHCLIIKYVCMYVSCKNLWNIFLVNACCYFPPNAKLLIRSTTRVGIFKRILKGHQFPSKFILRRYSTASVKPYKSKPKYSTIWKLERLMGWSLIILIPAVFAVNSKKLEMVLCITVLLHTYW